MRKVGEGAADDAHLRVGRIRILLFPGIVEAHVVDDEAALEKELLAEEGSGRHGHKGARLDPGALDLREGRGIVCDSRRERHDVGVLHSLLDRIGDLDRLDARKLFLHEGDEGVKRALATALDADRVERGAGCHEGSSRGLAHDARADDSGDLGILRCKVAGADAGDATGTVGREEVCRHEGKRGSRILVVQHHHEERGRPLALFSMLEPYHFMPAICQRPPR